MKIEIGNGGLGSTIILFMVVGFFIPEVFLLVGIVCFLMWIVGLCADRQVKQALKADSHSKIVLRGPETSAPVPTVLSEAESNEIIEEALAEAKRRVTAMTYCDHEARKKIFEAVFLRLCHKRGLKVDKLVWKKSVAE
jgi:Na+-transporting methylmalonyl-CoA/oxaloacetate decarboxylase gamma subunit